MRHKASTACPHALQGHVQFCKSLAWHLHLRVSLGNPYSTISYLRQRRQWCHANEVYYHGLRGVERQVGTAQN